MRPLLLDSLLAAFLLAACASTKPSTETGHGEDTVVDTAESGDANLACPEGMSLVGGDPSDAFCIFTYEATAEGDLNDRTACPGDPAAATATASSLAGVLPSATVSFAQALQICANTPVLDGQGATAGFLHLVTSQEWEDAGDSVMGEGGTKWPWGDDEPPHDLCAVPDEDGAPQVSGIQPTGSYPGCVSGAGVYDQIGNAWEWADPGVSLDTAPFVARAEADGRLVVGLDSVLVLDNSVLDELSIPIAGMSAATLGVDAGGTLVATCPTDAWTWGTGGNKGYLTWTLDGNRTVQPDPETSLPVEATWQSETAGTVSIRIAVLTQATGCPYTDKRGGAWYVGDVDLHGANYDHLYDFDGSIGFRCACAPLVR